VDFAFDESQTAVRELARGLFSKLHLATNLDLPAVWRELGRANLLGVGLPVAVGGSDSGFVALCCVLEQAGEVASPLPLLPALVFAGLPLARTGAAPATLAALCQGERVLCASYGTRGEPALRARREGETWVVSGSETCVEGAPLADQLLLAARGEAGPRMLFLVDRSTSGLTIEPQSVASGHSLGRIQLQDVRLSGAALVGDPGQADALIDWTLERAYVAQCAYELGLGGKALAMTARFAGERQQFGRPIGTFQAVAQRIADAHIAVETMRLTLWRAAWLVEQGVDARREIAVARTIATQAGHEVVCAAQHIHGSMGFDRDYPLYRYFLASKQNELLFGGHNFHLARLGKLLSCD
jgi:alkylation response protein AidB-like acyl-CoA dehydrogenase